MGKGKTRAPSQQDEDIFADPDAGQPRPTEVIEELASFIDMHPYTITELQHALLRLAHRDHAAHGGIPLICTHCMSSSTGETPCPHGTFPDDSREAPLLLYRRELIAVVEELFDVIVVPRNPSSVPTPTSREGHRRSSSAAVFPCAQGHSHSSAASAARCAPRPETPRSPSPTESSVSSVSGSVLSYASAAVPSRAQAFSTGGRAAASPARDRGSTSESASRSPGPSHSASGRWSNWSQVRDALPTIKGSPASAAMPVAAHAPATPARNPAPVTAPVVAAAASQPPPPYVANMDQPNTPGGRGWYVVTVGRTVGVFRNWVAVHRSTNKLPGNVQFRCDTYQEAVDAFHQAEANGEVEQRM